MINLKLLAALAAPAAIAFAAWSCERQPLAANTAGAPQFHFNQFECTPLKMTGGGRIDFPPGNGQKNPPASHEYETFGAHVIASGQVGPDGTCLADKGALEWIDHRNEWRINGKPLNLHATQITFAELATDTDCRDGAAHWGGVLVIRNTGQESRFEVWDCDNGEPGAGNDGFAIRLLDFPYEVMCPDESFPSAEPTCTLSGGNRQFHPTH